MGFSFGIYFINVLAFAKINLFETITEFYVIKHANYNRVTIWEHGLQSFGSDVGCCNLSGFKP